MKRVGLCLVPLVFLLLLSACGNGVSGGGQSLPVRTETVPFDLETAKGIVAKGDSLIAGLQTQDTISQNEAEQFLIEIKTLYGDNYPWNCMFFNNRELENTNCSELTVNQDYFFPTMYHQGMEIVSAEVSTEYFKEIDSFMDSQWLRIRMEYQGTDEALQGWNRTYEYRKWLEHPDWDWLFSSMKEASNMPTSKNCLSLKEDVPWPPASFQ